MTSTHFGARLGILAIAGAVSLSFGAAIASADAVPAPVPTGPIPAGPTINGCVIVLDPTPIAHTTCPGADLSHSNLIGANLSFAELMGANLRGANLAHAKFAGANLTDVNLSNAVLTNADFTGSNRSTVILYSADINIGGVVVGDMNITTFPQDMTLAQAAEAQTQPGGGSIVPDTTPIDSAITPHP